jgi:Phosphotransferase enzyme family
MRRVTAAELQEAIERFHIDGSFVDARALSRGHIHDTFVSRWLVDGNQRQFIHQRMNNDVFPDLDLLMSNIHRVSDHMVTRLGENGADGFEILRLVPTRNGNPYATTDSGAWRTYVFIENTASFDRCQSPEQAFEAARAFGWFQAQLHDLPVAELGETLVDFFSSPHRYRQFDAALQTCDTGRQAAAADTIQFAVNRQEMVNVIAQKLESAEIPARVIHGDTKLNNILFDLDTGKAKGIVDLDTCMAGYSLYDFGDLVRFTAATSAEDETDASLVGTDVELYEALSEGYLSTAGEFLTEAEVALMPFAARLVTFTVGLRFLADFLAGDHYFKVERPHHNLDRARVQFGMVADMERQSQSFRTGWG